MNAEDCEHCPACNSTDLSFGYGIAFGGLGVYTFCLDCDLVITKERKEPGECFHFDGEEPHEDPRP